MEKIAKKRMEKHLQNFFKGSANICTQSAERWEDDLHKAWSGFISPASL